MSGTPPTDDSVSRSIDLRTPLSIKSAFAFPLQSSIARKEVLIGALWLFVPIVGWLLNMGHRIVMTHKMQHGQPAWPSWNDYPALFKHGGLTFLGMVQYHAPAVIVDALGFWLDLPALHFVALLLWLLATIAVPGYMSHYCYSFDASEIFNPARALRRVLQGGTAYWHAWLIALSALALSFLGLLLCGVGFLVTSVWFWQVAGFSFATVFTARFNLSEKA